MNLRRFPPLVRVLVLVAGMAPLWSSVAPISRAQDLPALDPARALTQYPLDTWTDDDGLPQLSVTALLQTRDGYLWVGTQEGLARFDGLKFRTYNKANSALLKNDISALYEDRQGSLWVATRGGGLTQWRGGQMSSFSRRTGLPSDQVSAVAEDASGTLWVGTFDAGLVRLKDGRFTRPTEGYLQSGRVSAVVSDTQGNLWIGTGDAGLIRYQAGRHRTFTIADGLPGNEITRLLTAQDGSIWIGTKSGLAHLQHGVVTAYGAADGLPAGGITALYEDAAGTLWIGTDRTGLTRFSNNRFSTLSTADGLTGDRVTAIFSDHEGSLWVGTEGGGLNRLRDGKFTPYTTREGLGSNSTYAVYEDSDGALWIGTDGGGVTRLKNGTATTFTTRDGLGSNSVFSIWEGRDGSIWFGTHNGGLSRYRGGRFTTYTTKDGLPDNSIYALYEDTSGTLWVGTNHGLSRFRSNHFQTLTKADGLPSDFISAIGSDGQGHLAVGTYDGGLAILNGERVIAHYSTKNGLPSNFVLSLHPDAQGTLWLGLYEGGLARLKDGRVDHISAENGLFNDNIFQILEDDSGFLWVSCNQGLFQVKKEEVNAFMDGKVKGVHSTVYEKSDGLLSKEFNGGAQPAGWRSRDGRLWFPSSLGVVSIDPQHIRLNMQPPPVVIEGIFADGRAIPLSGMLRLPPGHSRLEIRYVGLSLIAPEMVQYQYRLVGVDDAWVDAGAHREAFYTKLPPGRYEFQVRAVNNDGVWSTAPASVSLYLEPFFYQTPWFFLLCGLGLVALSVGLYRLRIRHLTARHRELEAIVQDRTQKLREEIEKTERSKTIIEEQAERLREMDRIKTRFFGNISHEFRTPLTLNIGPLENALTGVYGSVGATMRKQLEIMLRNSRRLLRLINQLLDLSKLEAGKMHVRLRGGNLTELLEGIVLSFTAFAEKDNITLHFSSNPERLHVAFDPESLEKVFFNLLSNAVKFTPAGGTIWVTLEEKPPKNGGLGTIEVRVRDTGAGIPEDEVPYIFDRFRQVDGSVSRVQEGTGIGLSLAKELVELHGGQISVQSTVGEGTEFTVVLPREVVHPDDALVGDEDDEAAYVSRGPMVELAVFDEDDNPGGDGVSHTAETAGAETDTLILAVDDNPDIRAYVASCLQTEYRVMTAVDGQDALRKAREFGPDLIVSDVMMPQMNGYDLCRAVKSDKQIDHIPIILLTSRASLEDKIEGFEAGADDYVAKPFNARELSARVRSLLALRVQQGKLKNLNGELRQANEALRDVTDHKSQMLRLVAHDLKNPLSGVRELAKIVRGEVASEGDAAELLGLIQDASDRMLHLVSQLLESDALESGRLELHTEDLSLAALVADVVRANQSQADRKEQTIVYRAEGDGLCVVHADRDLLKEALDNLVNNAVKYSPPGKSIDVSVREEETMLLFQVHDQGPGLTEADKENLFKKFQRLSATPTGGESSTGLGLSIVKQIIELHGGRVWADGAPGEGSTFTIELVRHSVPIPTPA